MNESDLDYLRNINTRPGPNAGRSIDPTKPGPDAEPQDSDGVTRKNVEEWKRYFDEHAEEFVAAHEAIIRKAKSDAEPVNGILEASLPGIDDICPDPSAGLAELQERSLENNRLAFQWMEHHDKVVGFISKNYPSVKLPNLPFPSPVSRPDVSAGLIEIEEAFLWLADEPVDGTQKEKDDHLDKMPQHFNETIRKVRARAADRSGK